MKPKPRRMTLATHGDRDLVQYPRGEIRIEEMTTQTCSDWLPWRESEAYRADPATMETANLNNDAWD